MRHLTKNIFVIASEGHVPRLRRSRFYIPRAQRLRAGLNHGAPTALRKDTNDSPYPKTYFGSNSIPCFFNSATNSASKSIFL